MHTMGKQATFAFSRSRVLYSALGALCMTLYVCASVAQTASQAGTKANATSGTSAASSAVEEVVITAERREGTVQSTPISITAMSGEELQAQGVTSASELGAEIPGISEHNSGPG